MKKFLLIINLVLFNLIFSQVDTAQVIVPNRINTATNFQEKPYVIMISVDGFRYDYPQKYQTEHLNKLASQGVKAKYMTPSYPSITFPNHYTLVTGLYPSHHGLVDNFFYDYKRKEAYKMNDGKVVIDGSWYSGKPLWSLAEEQGLLSASLFWVSSQSDAGKTRPTYYYNYHEKFNNETKENIVLNWLKLPEEKRPHFITLYYPEVDANGHHHGPDAKETAQAVKSVDQSIGNLVQKINALGLKNVNFIFVSDHGMIKVDKEHTIDIPEILKDRSRFDYFNSQTLLRVKVKNADEIKQVYRELKRSKSKDYKIYTADCMPRRLHYGAKDDTFGRIGDIFLLPNAPKIFLEKGKTTTLGKHGYDPKKVPEMRAAFMAWGPAFKNNLEISAFNNVNVYPLVTKILGLKISSSIDGDYEIANEVLR
ncbi:alkaline phosphatase family protein [Soonwooa purpurea]